MVRVVTNRVGRMNRQLDELVAGTPAHRDRYVDLLRLVAIGVVVVWHWSLSVLHWSDGEWVMPNPIHQVPSGWLATWLLQVVPVFFLVGGYANAAAWYAAARDERGLPGYYRGRLLRLLVPIAVFLAGWALFELVAWQVVPGYRGVLAYALIVFTPLWFIVAYLWVVLLVPVTAALHARHRWLTVGVLAGAVVAADIGRFAGGLAWCGWLNTALVWVLIHQLGYFYRDATGGPGTGDDAGTGSTGSHPARGRSGADTVDRPAPPAPRRRPRTVAGRLRWWGAGLATGAVVLLALLTSLAAYPASMVATVGQERSNILPTTVPIVVVAVLQLGVILALREPVNRWLRRRRVWKVVVAGNSVILTIFLWHMTALLVVLAALRALGVELPTEPTAVWWAQRPAWLLAPALVLAPLVLLFGRFERTAARRPRGRSRAVP